MNKNIKDAKRGEASAQRWTLLGAKPESCSGLDELPRLNIRTAPRGTSPSSVAMYQQTGRRLAPSSIRPIGSSQQLVKRHLSRRHIPLSLYFSLRGGLVLLSLPASTARLLFCACVCWLLTELLLIPGRGSPVLG